MTDIVDVITERESQVRDDERVGDPAVDAEAKWPTCPRCETENEINEDGSLPLSCAGCGWPDHRR